MRSRLRGVAPAERQQIVAYSSSEDGSSTIGSSGAVSEHPEEGAKIRRTLGNLDALLGIEEEVPKDKQGSNAKVCLVDTLHWCPMSYTRTQFLAIACLLAN